MCNSQLKPYTLSAAFKQDSSVQMCFYERLEETGAMALAQSGASQTAGGTWAYFTWYSGSLQFYTLFIVI